MWVSHRGGPDDARPTPEQLLQWQRRMSPPDNEFPAGVGIAVLLGRTADAAVGISHVEAFSTGFRFTLSVRLREQRPELARGGLFMHISAHTHPDFDIPLEQRLLLGLEYPNGQRASTLQDIRMLGPGRAPDDDQVVLAQQGGGGGHQSIDQDYWVSPLPPDGPVTVVLTWPSFGFPESRTVLDGAAIRAAADRSQELWPPQPPSEPSPPAPPPRPTTGWFADPPD